MVSYFKNNNKPKRLENSQKNLTCESNFLTLTKVISIRILRMRLISNIIHFYWSQTIALQKLSSSFLYV